VSDDPDEAAHDEGAGPPGQPVAPGPPASAGDQALGEADSGEDVDVRSIPIGRPVDDETLAELKRRAEQPDTDAAPSQEDRG
jgi:hypothetical protein